jgi:putative ATPase
MDLFNPNIDSASTENKRVPLAERCRPLRLDDFVGHLDIIGEDSVLRTEIENHHLRSMILWGPPGVGKTTLARIVANEITAEFRAISAVSSGVKEVREVIDYAAKLIKHSGKTTILFIDEIHRFNKAQQDALLQAVEEGTIILIGATTENPSFEIISPLLSRVHVYTLKALDSGDIEKIINRALAIDSQLNEKTIQVLDWNTLFKLSNGDARRALTLLEKSLDLVPHKQKDISINKEILELAATRKIPSYDKSGEFHYDLASAFIKSLRGSDPDAAIYWMAGMLESGEDPKFIARRMLILASEDIGNADPQALVLATSGFTAINYVGLPEAKIILSQVAAYLAAAPKSNAAIRAINNAIEDHKNYPDLPVPLHLRNAPTSLLANLGYGENYQYAHDYDHHFVKENYLPPEIKNHVYYYPSAQGMESSIKARLEKLWQGIKNYNKKDKKKSPNHGT